MKIAITCFNLTWQAGGVRLIYSEAHALEKLGHQVVIYAPEFNKSVYPELWPGLDIRVVDCPVITWQYRNLSLFGRTFEKLKRERHLNAAAKRIALAMDGDFDIVNPHDFSYRIALRYKKLHPNARVVWYMADPPHLYLPKANPIYDVLSRFWNWYQDWAERSYLKSIDAVAVLISRNLAWARERGLSGGIVWTGIEFEKFYAPVKDIASKKRYTLMSVGALNQYRRFEDLILATKLLRDRGYAAHSVIVCKNIWQEDAYQNKLMEFVKGLGVEPYVKLMFEGASEKELVSLYTQSDFCVFPIHLPPPRSGFGWQMVVFEAMAAGTPVIVCNTNDVREAVTDDKTAIFVDPLSPDQIADKVSALIDSPEDYSRIALSGQKFVRENMSWESFADKILEITSLKK